MEIINDFIASLKLSDNQRRVLIETVILLKLAAPIHCSNFWNVFNQEYKYSPSCKSLGVKSLAMYIEKISDFVTIEKECYHLTYMGHHYGDYLVRPRAPATPAKPQIQAVRPEPEPAAMPPPRVTSVLHTSQTANRGTLPTTATCTPPQIASPVPVLVPGSGIPLLSSSPWQTLPMATNAPPSPQTEFPSLMAATSPVKPKKAAMTPVKPKKNSLVQQEQLLNPLLQLHPSRMRTNQRPVYSGEDVADLVPQHRVHEKSTKSKFLIPIHRYLVHCLLIEDSWKLCSVVI